MKAHAFVRKRNVLLFAPLSFVVFACNVAPPDETSATATSAVYAGELLSPARVGQAARAAGVPCGDRLVLAVAVAFGESEGYVRASHYNDFDGSVDRGLWQINSKYWPMYGESCVYDAACNAKAMAAISNNGASWTPWLAYTNGRYQQFMSQGREGAAAACNGTTGTGAPTSGAAPSGGATCAELGYVGKCFGEKLVWFENGVCRRVDCAARGQTCGWDGANGYNCVK